MKRQITFNLLFILLGYSFSAFAGGFQLWTQDAKNVGVFGAGAAAVADDASTTFYNPAGLTRIKRQDATFSIIAKVGNIKYKGNTSITPAITDFSPSSGTVQGGDMRWLPTIFYAAPTGKKWGFGLSLTSPFDLDVNYGTGEFTRYTVTRHDIRLYDLSPAFGYRLLPTLSIGAGLNVQHIEIQYNQVDNSTTSTANDTLSKNDLTDWATGWNAGVLWEPRSDSRIGLHYRSQIIHETAGESNANNTYLRVRARFVTPPSTTLSLFQSLSSKVDLLGTISFTQWHSFGNFVLKNTVTSSGTGNVTVQNNMRNTWLFSLGSRYQLTPGLTLRGAIGYDESAAKGDNQQLTIPDGDRYIASIGLGYQFTNNFSFDAGYLHSFSTRSHVNDTQVSDGKTITNIGNFDLADDMIGFQINWFMT